MFTTYLLVCCMTKPLFFMQIQTYFCASSLLLKLKTSSKKKSYKAKVFSNFLDFEIFYSVLCC